MPASTVRTSKTKKLITRLTAVLATTLAAATTFGTAAASAAKAAHADGIHINATSNALGKTKSFLHLMQVAGY